MFLVGLELTGLIAAEDDVAMGIVVACVPNTIVQIG